MDAQTFGCSRKCRSIGSAYFAGIAADHAVEVAGRKRGDRFDQQASLGRAFSGISVGLVGSLIGIHWSLALATMIVAGGLLAVR